MEPTVASIYFSKYLPTDMATMQGPKGCFPDLNFGRMQTCSVYLVSCPFLCHGFLDKNKACTKKIGTSCGRTTASQVT